MKPFRLGRFYISPGFGRPKDRFAVRWQKVRGAGGWFCGISIGAYRRLAILIYCGVR